MRLVFWGTRGGFVAPGAQFLRYGGATVCTEIVSDAGARLVVDLGSGAIALGGRLMADPARTKKLAVLLSHTQFDHIMGLPFFAPALVPGFELTVMGPSQAGEHITRILDKAFHPDYSPLYSVENLKVNLRTLAEGDLWWEGMRIRARELPHEGSSALGFRVEVDGKVLALMPDLSWDRDPPGALFDIAGDADLLVHDSMGRMHEPGARVAHPLPVDAARSAAACGARRLMLYHHDPDLTDDALDAILAELRPKFSLVIEGARQGSEILL